MENQIVKQKIPSLIVHNPPKPYYQDDKYGITIYHGDCRDILPELEPVDLVLTDPPYGVGVEYGIYQDTIENWRKLMNEFLPLAKELSSMAIMPCCRIVELQWIYTNYPPDWLIAWHKGSPGTSAWVGFNDWEPLLVYGKVPGVQMHDFFYVQPTAFTNGHPCPKPIKWAKWLISRASFDNQIILDPFMGSGTTLVAAKELGRKAIGIEIEEKYCEIAVRRLQQDVFQWS